MQVLKSGEVLYLDIMPTEGARERIIALEANAELILNYRITNVQSWQEACVIHLQGSGAKVKIRGIMHGVAKADLQYGLTVNHSADHTESDIEFRTVAEDKSRIMFDGLIKVLPHVKSIVANEQNRNLLLSNEAVVESRPRLEIDSNEVACRHGSTVGDLDPEQLFYLCSRGIAETEARQILITAFLEFIA